MIRFLVIAALLAIPTLAWSQGKSPEPICEAKDARENFACSIEGAYTICKMQAALALQTSDWTPVQGCKKKYQPAVRKSYDAALARLKGKPAAQKEAKVTYAQWIAVTDGLMPKTDENRISYRRRTGSLDDALNKNLATFKIESGIE